MDNVLSLRVCQYAEAVGLRDVLTSRDLAGEMLSRVLSDTRNSLEAGSIIDCSFESVTICDTSFADQFILNLQSKILSLDNVLMRLSHCEVGVLENINAALAYRNERIKKQISDVPRLNILLFSEGSYKILGHIEKSLEQAFEVIQKTACGVTARILADTLEIEGGNNAANRLKKLYDLRLVCRSESIDETGRQFVYYIPEG